MENITVGGLFEILDKRIVINVFEAGNNELLFDSSKWNGKNYLKRKRWDDIKNRNVLIFRRGETEMPDKMSFEEMISLLDGACGRLIVASMASPVVREAKEMITKVSLSLGEWAEELEG